MHLGSPNHELSPLISFLWFEPIDFFSKMVPCRFSFDLLLSGLGTSSTGRGSNLCVSIDRIALFHWTLNLLV